MTWDVLKSKLSSGVTTHNWPFENRDCTIKFCDESDLPEFISEDEEKRTRDKMTGDNQNDVSRDESKEDAECSPQDLSEVNETISSENELNLDSLFECESEDDDPDSRYIDLLLNPERYTGMFSTNY